MAQQLVSQRLCDWHRALPSPEQIEATTKRIVSSNKAVDLCGFCGFLWDLGLPRLDELLQLLRSEVMETLMRSAHTIQDTAAKDTARAAPLALPAKDTGHAAQLSLTAEPAAPKKETTAKAPAAKPTSSGKKSVANRGRWIEGVDQVRCPKEHRGAHSSTDYWVAVEKRGSHASSSHKMLAQEIDWEEPPGKPVRLPYVCTEHKVCAAYNNGAGYGFPTKGALTTHIQKCEEAGWEKAAGKSTTATQKAAQPAA